MLVRSRSRNTGAQGRRRLGNPMLYAEQYGLKLWLRADMGITLGGTLLASGTTPPVVTITGTPTSQVGLHVEIDSVAGGTGLGQATFKWSTNNGTSYVATGVATAASVVLGTTGVTAQFAAGPYNIDNKWDATVSAWADQSGNGNHATQATAAQQPVFSLAGYGGHPGLHYGGGLAKGLATGAIALNGAQTLMGAMQGAVGTAWVLVHIAVQATANGSEVFGRTGGHAAASRANVRSTKTASPAAYLSDGLRHTFAMTCDGTHAGHLLYRDGAAYTTVTALANDTGAASASGVLSIGNNPTFTNGVQQYMHEVMAWDASLPASVVRALHLGMAARAPGAL
jgi:hypothetical protein